ncbi:MAG: hypothetical protein MZV70_66820 [Desulfobacterales bacterium]|nr:hypothetical protein [Desulfobacterales bacterium]
MPPRKPIENGKQWPTTARKAAERGERGIAGTIPGGQEDRQEALEDIERRDRQGGLPAPDPQDVGRPGAPAAEVCGRPLRRSAGRAGSRSGSDPRR